MCVCVCVFKKYNQSTYCFQLYLSLDIYKLWLKTRLDIALSIRR